VKNWTPQALRCGFGSCPSMHELEDGRLRIVGYMDDNQDGTGEQEMAIIIDRALLGDLIRDEVEKAVQAERERCAKVAGQKTVQMPIDSDFTRGYTEGRLAVMRELAAIRSAPSQEDKP